MSTIARQTTWASLQTLTASALNNEFNNIVNAWNNHDSGSSQWTTVTCSGVITANGQLIGKGTITNDNASAGYIGEQQENDNAGVLQNLTNGQFVNLTSVTLTAGDWDVYAVVSWSLNGATSSGVVQAAISINTGNTTTDQVEGNNQLTMLAPISSASTSVCIANYRITKTSSGSVFIKALANFSAGTMQARGRISARRVR